MISKKRIDNDEEKVRDHCHVTGKIKVRLIDRLWHLRGHDTHLFFNKLDKFDVKTDIIPNGLEKYMASFFE